MLTVLNQIKFTITKIPEDGSWLNHAQERHSDVFRRQILSYHTFFLSFDYNPRYIPDDILNDAVQLLLFFRHPAEDIFRENDPGYRIIHTDQFNVFIQHQMQLFDRFNVQFDDILKMRIETRLY